MRLPRPRAAATWPLIDPRNAEPTGAQLHRSAAGFIPGTARGFDQPSYRARTE